MGTKQFFDTVGLGTPFMFALGIYGFFSWLDRNSSVQAKSTIAKWLRGQAYRELDLQAAIISAFDRLYSAPLLKLRAFFRSAAISLVVVLIFDWMYSVHLILTSRQPTIYQMVVPTIVDVEFTCVIIIADYAALFAIRKILTLSGIHPFLAFLSAMLASACIATSVITTIIVIVSFYWFGTGHDLFEDIRWLVEAYSYEAIALLFAPAFFVHLWLPLFALGALAVRGFYLFFDLARLAQWFLRGGSRHPVRAIGAAAAVLVFVGAGITTVVTRLHALSG